MIKGTVRARYGGVQRAARGVIGGDGLLERNRRRGDEASDAGDRLQLHGVVTSRRRGSRIVGRRDVLDGVVQTVWRCWWFYGRLS